VPSRSPRHAGTTKPQLAQIGVRLPVAALRILDGEAACYGWARGQFLDALVWHKYGQGLRLERLASAPRYRFKTEDWTTTERWLWYLRPETKSRLDELRMKMGNIKPAAWIVLALNEWIGGSPAGKSQ
jgi:hypothetical protein